MNTLRICTYNIHKGFSQFNRQLSIHGVRDKLHQLGADLVFLQEVQGQHLHHARRHLDWPSAPQHEFLAEGMWPQCAYGGNAIYDHGHHGNAILSRHAILSQANQDVSDHRFEHRGLLHCTIRMGRQQRPVHCICVHLGLTGGSRRRQMAALVQRLEQLAPPDEALIIAGDFNDWRQQADDCLTGPLGVQEVFTTLHGQPARSFPSRLPMLPLDRIYVRGFEVLGGRVHHGAPWHQLSDHAPLTAQLRLRDA
jgi:endonuclease/exonuclease/phosphatase family metal-dependent hydrolase